MVNSAGGGGGEMVNSAGYGGGEVVDSAGCGGGEVVNSAGCGGGEVVDSGGCGGERSIQEVYGVHVDVHVPFSLVVRVFLHKGSKWSLICLFI